MTTMQWFIDATRRGFRSDEYFQRILEKMAFEEGAAPFTPWPALRPWPRRYFPDDPDGPLNYDRKPQMAYLESRLGHP